MKKIIRLTESDLIKLVKRVIEEETKSNPHAISPENKKLLWNKISSNSEIKKHLDIMPHHTENNFWEEIGHKLHVHVDPKGEHIQFEFPGLGKQHNINLNVGGSYNTHHYSNNGETSWKKPIANVGISTNFGGNKKTQIKQF